MEVSTTHNGRGCVGNLRYYGVANRLGRGGFSLS